MERKAKLVRGPFAVAEAAADDAAPPVVADLR